MVVFFMSIQERFKEERERLRLTQPEVAALVEVGKTTVINWEKGQSSPTAAQLEVLAAEGMDVLYVITGRYAGGIKPAPSLSTEEGMLLEYFREASKDVKRAALGALIGAAPGLSMTNTAPGGVQIGQVTGKARVINKKG